MKYDVSCWFFVDYQAEELHFCSFIESFDHEWGYLGKSHWGAASLGRWRSPPGRESLRETPALSRPRDGLSLFSVPEAVQGSEKSISGTGPPQGQAPSLAWGLGDKCQCCCPGDLALPEPPGAFGTFRVIFGACVRRQPSPTRGAPLWGGGGLVATRCGWGRGKCLLGGRGGRGRGRALVEGVR